MTKRRWRLRDDRGPGKDSWAEADYDSKEDALVLSGQAIARASSAGSKQRREAINSVDVLHEFKVLLDASVIGDSHEKKG